ncbi:MAG: hypothetical protein KI792_07135 [Alphaproteobacteria bacterium]|nr:hypothetical protein [Alphaproteobacteria bacterium SS10]
MAAVPAATFISSTAITMNAAAGEADVIRAEISPLPGSSNEYRVTATIEHADEGWDHYADAFDVVAPNGDVLGTRVLHHPHVTEQPFTRSLSRVAIPFGINEVTIRAHDSVHGHGGQTITLSVPR